MKFSTEYTCPHMGPLGKPSDHNTSHRYRLTAIPLTRYPLTSIRLEGSQRVPIEKIRSLYGIWINS